ncbi:MAG TPA: hypothetical protein VEH27_00845 [Methylomirabilota bacterium]|nr:hypothetical protein [Methylomirabilota bacterium]
MNTAEVDQHLDDVAVNQLVWKPGVLRTIGVEIARHAVRRRVFWPDELDFSKVAEADKNCIGIAYRLLSKYEIITRNGNYRRSETGDSKGRTIFDYRIINDRLAQAFIDRNTEKANGQLQLI